MVDQRTFQEALRGLLDRDYCASIQWEKQQQRANREGAHEKIVEFERTLVRRAAKLGLPLYAHCVVRTSDEQLRLFVEGKSKDSPDDGFWPHRRHAVDIVHGQKHWNMTRKQWAMVGVLGKEVADSLGIKVEWGGDWRFYDPAHWQLKGWRVL